MFDSQSSIEYIESQFPELSEELHNELWDGLLHMQISVFSRLAQKAIDDGNSSFWSKISSIFLKLWCDCTPDVKNALNVSFLENIYFQDDEKIRSWAYQAMPMEMQKAWDHMETYNQQLHTN